MSHLLFCEDIRGKSSVTKLNHFVGIFLCQPSMVLKQAETKPRSGKPSHVTSKIPSFLCSENVRMYGTVLHKKASFLSMGGGGEWFGSLHQPSFARFGRETYKLSSLGFLGAIYTLLEIDERVYRYHSCYTKDLQTLIKSVSSLACWLPKDPVYSKRDQLIFLKW